MSGKIKIGMGQLLVEGGEPERNLERALLMIQQAAAENCQIILLPETMDLAWTHPSAKDEAMSIPGMYSQQLVNTAIQYKIYVCAGLTEKRDGKVFNTAILINPKGEIIIKYSKINLLTVEQDFYQIGDSLHVVDTEFGKIGVNICADNYPEALSIGHTLARMGAQIILSPSSWTVDYHVTEEDDPYKEKWLKPYLHLASLYNMIIIGTTSVGYLVGGPYEGKKSVGCSLAVGKNGILTQGTFNEFSGELIVTEFEIPIRNEKGTEIGDMLKKKGQNFY